MILIIDNYDSFVHTLARYVGLCGRERRTIRNDRLSAESILIDPPAAVILSPGPGHPQETGVCQPLIRQAAGRLPILGVCLGHQAIVTAYGGIVGRAGQPMHGRCADIHHHDDPLFAGIPRTAPAARYHSLCAEKLPAALRPIATSDEGDIMAVRHTTHPVWGVQFHPESILTPDGITLIKNFLALAEAYNRQPCTG